MQSHCRRKPCTVVANNDHIGAASLLQVPLSEIQKVAQVQVRFFSPYPPSKLVKI